MHLDALAAVGAPVCPRELARTYNRGAYDDPWEVVIDYSRALEAVAEDPDRGPTSIAREIDIPRSRLRPWLDGSLPDPVRAIEVVDALGWMLRDDEAIGGDVGRALNVLVTWIYSGGSIKTDTYTPFFTVDDFTDADLLERSGQVLGVEMDFTRKASSQRATELRPIRNASLLGRVLYVLGAPVGEKNEAAEIELPGYLRTAPEVVLREFVQVYLQNRGQRYQDKRTVTMQESRSVEYLQSLAALIQRVTGENVSVSGKDVIVSADAARQIESWPEPFGDVTLAPDQAV